MSSYAAGEVNSSGVASQIMSEECYRWMTLPLLITGIGLDPKGSGGRVQLRWQGGSPPFRVEHCDDMLDCVWQSGEVTFEMDATMAISAPRLSAVSAA